jgi:rRNA-processing protein FCF1
VSKPGRSPLEGVDRVIVDGNNLLHAISRGPTGLPAAALIGRLRGAIPSSVGIELVFDGQPEPGLRGQRIASGLIVRHSGRRTADELITSLVEEARGGAGPEGADNVLVVTDDAELRSIVHRLGAATTRTAWLLARLERERLETPSTGNRRPPRSTPEPVDEDDRRTWRPGRGATTKRGNPRRSSRGGRGPTSPGSRGPTSRGGRGPTSG